MIGIHDESFIIHTWQEIVENALHAKASDIHIEARPLSSLVRIRVDGLLQTQYEYPIVLIQISTIIQSHFLVMSICFLACVLAFLIGWNKYPQLQKKCDRWLLRAPLLGKLLRIAALQYWCRTLGHLLESGLPLPDALRVTAQSSNHWTSHDLSAEIFKHITRDWPFGEALQKADPQNRFFDFETLQLLHISSESGLLANMLSKRANTLSDQLSKQLNNLGQTLEPLLIILIGIIIGGLVIVLYLPIFHLGQIV